VVAVMIDEPTGGSHFGGDVAAPVFSTIVGETLRALNVAPDASVSKKALQDQSSTDTHIAIANTQPVVLKR